MSIDDARKFGRTMWGNDVHVSANSGENGFSLRARGLRGLQDAGKSTRFEPGLAFPCARGGYHWGANGASVRHFGFSARAGAKHW